MPLLLMQRPFAHALATQVKNDIPGAMKFYAEGNRLGTTDPIMNMDFNFAAQGKMDFLVNM